MNKFPRFTAALVLAIAAPGVGAQLPDGDKPPSLDIEGMTCRYLLTAGGDERDLLLSFFHGYMAGKAGDDAEHNVETMADTTDKVIEYCVDAPSQPLVKAFAEAQAGD